MKIIHCADLHLDSPFAFLDDRTKVSERRAELVRAFQDMVDYGVRQGVSAVLIAGDLFDTNRISAGTRNVLLGAVKANPGMDFYYLKGNHDRNDFLSSLDSVPGNLHTFTDTWTQYDLGEGVALTSVELSQANSQSIYTSLVLNQSKFNIVMLHGQEAASVAKDKAEVINLNALKNKGIDYLALGHVHSFKTGSLDARASYCYPGCLEARGFDESGPHGFVVLDIDTNSHHYTQELVSRPIRSCHVVNVDISACPDTPSVISAVKAELDARSVSASDLVEVCLTGSTSLGSECSEAFVNASFNGEYYFFKLKNVSSVKVDFDVRRQEQSLAGEFIRTVEGRTDLSTEEKGEIIRIGLAALGEGGEL